MLVPSPYVRCPSCGRRFVPGASNFPHINPAGNGALAAASPLVLHSWKEIASYVGSGVRTVQRWEHDFGLPVRRLAERARTAVMAFPEEIDAWLHQAPTAPFDHKRANSAAPQAVQAKDCA